MLSTNVEILTARLTRMKALVESLEDACSSNMRQRELFLQLKGEMAAACDALKLVLPPDSE